jgi:hypothetical protein
LPHSVIAFAVCKAFRWTCLAPRDNSRRRTNGESKSVFPFDGRIGRTDARM